MKKRDPLIKLIFLLNINFYFDLNHSVNEEHLFLVLARKVDHSKYTKNSKWRQWSCFFFLFTFFPLFKYFFKNWLCTFCIKTAEHNVLFLTGTRKQNFVNTVFFWDTFYLLKWFFFNLPRLLKANWMDISFLWAP